MIADSFDARTLANMEIALERACDALGSESAKHHIRRRIARNILRCAKNGDMTLNGLTAAGHAVVTLLARPRSRTDASEAAQRVNLHA
jgi:hypothetical protein